MGAELVARGHAVELSSASAAGRWATEKHSISATLGNRGLDLCYARAMKPYLTVAGMLEVFSKTALPTESSHISVLSFRSKILNLHTEI